MRRTHLRRLCFTGCWLIGQSLRWASAMNPNRWNAEEDVLRDIKALLPVLLLPALQPSSCFRRKFVFLCLVVCLWFPQLFTLGIAWSTERWMGDIFAEGKKSSVCLFPDRDSHQRPDVDRQHVVCCACWDCFERALNLLQSFSTILLSEVVFFRSKMRMQLLLFFCCQWMHHATSL